MTTKLYVENVELYNQKLEQKYLKKEKITVKNIHKGTLLPPKKTGTVGTRGSFSGGVVDQKMNFVSGNKRCTKTFNYNCESAYEPQEEIDYFDEDVIFGGILMPAFGNVMIESLSRLWYVVKNKNDRRKIVFLKFSRIEEFHYKFLELLNIEKDRIEIIEKPTKYKNITVPEESVAIWSYYKKEYNLIYDEIRKNIKPKKYEKVYFTRTQLKERYDVNEEFFENFYKKRGYKIVSPEKLPLREQIEYAAGAKELVCSIGTLSHFGLFMDYHSKLVIFNRTKTKMLVPQFLINDARKLNVSFIDAIIEFLPIYHDWSCACMYPTEYFKEYLKEEKINYTEKEIVQDEKSVIYEYLKNYAQNYKKPLFFRMIQKYDMYDLVRTLNKHFFNEEIKIEELYTKGTDEHTKEWWIKNYNKVKLANEDLVKENDRLKKELEKSMLQNKKIHNSASWKITKPLRAIKEIFKKR